MLKTCKPSQYQLGGTFVSCDRSSTLTWHLNVVTFNGSPAGPGGWVMIYTFMFGYLSENFCVKHEKSDKPLMSQPKLTNACVVFNLGNIVQRVLLRSPEYAIVLWRGSHQPGSHRARASNDWKGGKSLVRRIKFSKFWRYTRSSWPKGERLLIYLFSIVVLVVNVESR